MLGILLLLIASIIANLVLLSMYSNTKHLLRLKMERLEAVMRENETLFFDQFKRSGCKKEPFDDETFH